MHHFSVEGTAAKLMPAQLTVKYAIRVAECICAGIVCLHDYEC